MLYAIFTWNNGTMSAIPCRYSAECVPRYAEPSGTTWNKEWARIRGPST